jgi:hypothetical protein
MMIPVAWSVEVCIWFLQAVCYGSIVLSYGALGVMNLLGPLFIPWLIVPESELPFLELACRAYGSTASTAW